MTFVSYAQNFEDVLLWRALGHIEAGFYIDVGASHPDSDSVTRAFYDRGWHGINVEPTRPAFIRLEAARPRDLNLCIALGRAAGTAAFHAVQDAASGLSTLDGAAAARYREMGYASVETRVQVETLAAVCREHAPADIHFLKIDVEGAERQVLEGADFTAFRPWIVLVEATAPMSTTEVHAEWEGLLEQARYQFLWFDGLNRYYAAAERYEAMAPSFRTPPNVFDDFLRASDTEWTRRIEQAETRAGVIAAHVDVADRRAGIAEDRAEIANLRLIKRNTELLRSQALAEHRQREIEQLHEDMRAAGRRAADLQSEIDAKEAWLEAMRASTSWRITAPLRRALGGRDQAPAASKPVAEAVGHAVAALAEHGFKAPDQAAVLPGKLRAVHQFHSGSAVGDAITNAMLLTRRLLRGLGYDSHIFVQHKDPACGDDIHLIGELPAHDRYVLIVRHSMGHDIMEHILALPAPKVLIYHNITPAEFLSDSPFMASYAAKGRAQLAQLRGAVAASLADSEYNALELRRAGFEQPVACSLLVDVDAIAARALPRHEDGVFTVLFVGRITRSKGQIELVEAFARFHALFGGDCKLVLVGRHEPGDAYLQEIFGAIRRHGLQHGPIEVTGLVSDSALRGYYAQADLYVSLSQHEGFGVPLLEAMAYGVPVLAFPAGAVPYTLGGASEILADMTPSGTAARIHALAIDPAARSAIVRRQREVLQGLRVEAQLPHLVAALRVAGAAPPAESSAFRAIADNIQVTVCGHVNGTYSLAEVNRAFALEIDRARPGSVRLLPVEGEVTTDVTGIPAEQRPAIRELLARPAFASAPHVLVSQHYPVWVPDEAADLRLALFFWEETIVPAETIAGLGRSFDGVLAPSAAVAKALIDSGCPIPVHVVGHAPQLDPFRPLKRERTVRSPDRMAGEAGQAGAPFTFLHVSSCFPRKGVDALLAAYARAFRRADRVRLVVKGFPNPHNDVAAQIAALQAADPEAPAIELIDRDLDAAGLLALYREADVMVLPTRGEGYNLPAAEALAAGLPLIVTGAGGHMDFVTDLPEGDVRLLRYGFAPAATHLSTPFSLWAEPDGDDLVAALREAVHRGRHIASGLRPSLPGVGGEQADLAARLGTIVARLLLAPAPRPLSVAWITTWDVQCGIAEYSRHLIGASSLPGRVLTDIRTPSSGDALPLQSGAATAVLPAWRVFDQTSLPGLAAALLSEDPTVVMLQHQPGLMPWPMLAALLQAPVLQGRVVCAVLHNTRHLLELSDSERATILRALAGISRVVVHTLADLNRLSGFGLGGNVTLIAQGVPERSAGRADDAEDPEPDEEQPVLERSAPVLLGCYGFFLPGKGIPELIEAFGRLRRRWPQARLRLVNAEYPLGVSIEEIARCRQATAEAGLEDAIEFVTDFLDHGASQALLAACDLIVLPYQHSIEASSAAVRAALVVGVPVAVTPLSLFDEADDAVLRLPGLSPADIEAGIERALLDPAMRTASVAAARIWMSARSWTRTGRRWDAMIRALVASNVVGQQGDASARPDQGEDWKTGAEGESDASHPLR